MSNTWDTLKGIFYKRREFRFLVLSDLVSFVFVVLQTLTMYHILNQIRQLLYFTQYIESLNGLSFTLVCVSDCIQDFGLRYNQTLDIDLIRVYNTLQPIRMGFSFLILLKWLGLLCTVFLHFFYVTNLPIETSIWKMNLRSRSKLDYLELSKTIFFGLCNIAIPLILYFLFANTLWSQDCSSGFMPFESFHQTNLSSCPVVNPCRIYLPGTWLNLYPFRYQWCLQVIASQTSFSFYQQYQNLLQVIFKNTIFSVLVSVLGSIKSLLLLTL